MIQLKGNVIVAERKNADGGRTFYLRWNEVLEDGTTKIYHRRVFRSEAKPTQKSLRDWRREARNLAASHQKDLAGGMDDSPPRRRVIPLLDAFELYMVWVRGDEMHKAPIAKCTADMQERVIDGFINFVGEDFPKYRNVWQLSHNHTGIWRNRRHSSLKDTSLATECSHLQAFLDFCMRQGWMAKRLVVLPKEERRNLSLDTYDPKILPDERVRAIIEVQNEELRRGALFALAATGLRQGELRALLVGDWDSADKVLAIPRGQFERNKRHERDIPAGPHLAELLDSLAKNRHRESYVFAGVDEMPIGQSRIN